MTGFGELFVQYGQMVISGDWEGGGLSLYWAGGQLLHVTGPGEVTVMTGRHTGYVQVRAVGLMGPPADDRSTWDAAEQATIWVPEGSIRLNGLMGDALPTDPDLALAGAGLYRVEARARNRYDEGASVTDDTAPEQHELLVWPVREDAGHLTVGRGQWSSRPRQAQPAHVAERAMLGLLTGNCSDPFDRNAREMPIATPETVPGLPRVEVVRRAQVSSSPQDALRAMQSVLGLTGSGTVVLPAGPLKILLVGAPADAPEAEGWRMSWSWDWTRGVPDPVGPDAWATQLKLPDRAASWVEVSTGSQPSGSTVLAVHHRQVLGGHAVLLGLIWEHILTQAQTLAERQNYTAAPWPWEPTLDQLVDRERTRERSGDRMRLAARKLFLFGGRPFSPRLRDLDACVRSLARHDRDLLDALAAAPPTRQRDVAVWAAQTACDFTGLTAASWITDALAALQDGEPALTDRQHAWDLLLSDASIPRTYVEDSGGDPHCLQQAIAFQALLSLDDEDPLAAAVNSVYEAGHAHGRNRPLFAQQLRTAFPDLRP